MELENIGRILILMGLAIVFLGVILFLASKTSFLGLGRLPGDIFIQRDNVSFFFPIVTMIILSVILSIALSLIGLLFRR